MTGFACPGAKITAGISGKAFENFSICYFLKKIIILFTLQLLAMAAIADHITGGEIYYTYVSASDGLYRYHVTLKLFMVCNTERQFNDPTFVSFFNRGTGVRVKDMSVALERQETISETPGGPCISNPPTICYRVGYYNFDVTLPASAEGYTIAAQVIYRVDGMKNLVEHYDRVGASYIAEIPGNAGVSNAPENNGAHFTGDDLVVICANNAINYSFAATDKDGDKLLYSFCEAYRESSGGFGQDAAPPGTPPYAPLPYGQGYSATSPLGPNVHIDANTGLITGVAPGAGIYVITVCVQEIRNNVVIAQQRKDIQVNITECSIAAATLLPEYILCGDTKNISIKNESTSPLIKTLEWDFINAKGDVIYTTQDKQPTYTFPDSGLYQIKLSINKGDLCSDTSTTTARVYPGFLPDFNFDGVCLGKQTQFFDQSTSQYGKVNSWNWDFGDAGTLDDFSLEQNPNYTYKIAGNKSVKFVATDTKGCIDTIYKTVPMSERPPVQLAYTDTLICIGDSVQLRANASGEFTWSPVLYMNNANLAAPLVSPPVTTKYYVDLNDNGCLNRDSVVISVVDHVTLSAMSDTTICSGDPVQLKVNSNALKFSWTPASQLDDPNRPIPVAKVNNTTTFDVIAVIGGCSAAESITINAVPYPLVVVGADTVICYQTGAQLHALTNGSSFTWSPQTSLLNGNTLNPFAYPSGTTSYILYAFDNKGCPKPGTDTVTVTVLPDLKAFAGRDTIVVVGQSLQLSAGGGTTYRWSPSTGLSATDIANPVALYNLPSDGIRYHVLVYNEAGCVDSASLTVKVYHSVPNVFVPTAFTPNGDGRNDVLRPIAVGIQHIEFFNIYNRWGQLLFSTKTTGKGWDGSINGLQQNPGVYVWMVKAIDYTGKPVVQKGTVTLIR